MNKPKRKVHAFNFKAEGSHVALVDRAANLQTVLTMKAAEPEVTVSLTMREFLQKFFSLWSEDAEILAGILGYNTGYEDTSKEPSSYYDNYIGSKIDQVSLLKGQELPEKLPESITTKIETLMKSIGDKLTSEDLPLGANNLKGDSKLSEVKISKEELDALKAKATEADTLKSAQEEVDVLKSQLQEVETLKSMVEALKLEKANKAKQEMTTLIKGYSFVPEADQDKLVEFLVKSEDPSVILTTLEKARDAIGAAVSIETGAEGTGTVEEEETQKGANDLVTNLINQRYKKS